MPGDLSESTTLPDVDRTHARETAFLIISSQPPSPPSLSIPSFLTPPQATSASPSDPSENISSPPASNPKILHLHLDPGKKGQHTFLYSILPRSLDFITFQLSHDQEQNVCIACESGKDASVGVAVAALQVLFDDEGRYRGGRSDGLVDGHVGSGQLNRNLSLVKTGFLPCVKMGWNRNADAGL